VLSFAGRENLGDAAVITATISALEAAQLADATQLDPEEATGLFPAFEIERFQEELDEICMAIPRSVERTSRVLQMCSFQLHRNLGILFADRGDWGQAYKALRIAKQIVPDDAQTLLQIGRSLGALGQVSEAVHHYRRAIFLEPFLTAAVVGLAELLVANNRATEAVEPLQNALYIHREVDEWRLGVYLLLAETKSMLGDRDSAIALWQNGLTELRTGRLMTNIGTMKSPNVTAREDLIEDLERAFTSALQLAGFSVPPRA
ncbi:MAG: hypothetical protein O3A46_16620, partial [Candidatus Poribacteria bacterium]|nr:hypothetical protein [Candidatus Poribacteria bacterium]